MEKKQNKALPREFLSRIRAIYPNAEKIIATFSRGRVGSFRVNGNKFPMMNALPGEILGEFSEKNITAQTFPEIPGVFTFSRDHEYAIKGTRAFYDGKIYLQGISSMLPALLLDPQKGENILDVCSAPGSKTTLLSVMMRNTGKITAIEQNQIRMEKLKHNAKLQGATNIFFVKADARNFLEHHEEKYEKILLDAPCSAEGRISVGNEKTYGFWSLENIHEKAKLQYSLLESSVKKLKSGGTLIYSTCTFAPEENEAIISQILENNHALELVSISEISKVIETIPGIPSFQGKTFHRDITKTLRILPSEVVEGFFIAKLRKI